MLHDPLKSYVVGIWYHSQPIPGIGGQTALKLIRQHGSIENILQNINKERSELFIYDMKWSTHISG